MDPQDLLYTQDHEWLRVEGSLGRVGITQHAQKQLGDVVFLELPEAGRELKRHDVFGTVESVKAVSELFAPVSGRVVEANAAAVEKPEVLNADPYGTGWLVLVELADVGELRELMNAAAYAAYAEGEAK